MEKIVVDTSIIIDGEITKLIEANDLNNSEIIIPVAVLDELQSQASPRSRPLQASARTPSLCDLQGVASCAPWPPVNAHPCDREFRL